MNKKEACPIKKTSIGGQALMEGIMMRGPEVTAMAVRNTKGELVVEGEGIKIGALDTDRGVVTLSGRIDGFFYVSEEKNEKRGFFSRFSR